MAIQISGVNNTISPTTATTALKFTAISASQYINVLGNTGATPVIDLSLGNFVTATLNQDTTFSFVNAPTQAVSFTLFLTNDGTPGRNVVWPATVKWPGGGAPTRTTAASKTDIYTFLTIDSGLNWYGNLVAANY
jgi:hypothetical protein